MPKDIGYMQLQKEAIVLKEPYWKQQDTETDLQYSRFTIYRDTPATKRSLRKLAADLGITYGAIAGISRHFAWDRRSKAWDDHLDEIAMASSEETVRARSAAHANAARRVIDFAMAKLEGSDLAAISVHDALKLIPEMIKVERLALGMSTDNQAVRQESTQHVTVDYVNDWRGPARLPALTAGVGVGDDGDEAGDDNDKLYSPSLTGQVGAPSRLTPPSGGYNGVGRGPQGAGVEDGEYEEVVAGKTPRRRGRPRKEEK